MPDFDRTFRLLTGHVRMFSWQRRLFHDWFLGGRLPDEIDLPAGLGKTSVMALWLMALAVQRGEGRKERLPLRYVHVVDDRALVDQASVEAGRLARNLGLRPGLEWMRRALGLGRRGLAVSTLHGEAVGSTRWLADPASPAIIVVTEEEAVSGLLFDGGGPSPRARTARAAMLGVDSLIVVDEIRLMPRFVRLVAGLVGDGTRALWPPVEGIRPPRFLPMSAAGCGGGTTFRLEAADHADGDVARRLEAVRHLRIERTDTGDGTGGVLAARLADAAWRLAHGGGRGAVPPRTVVFCDDGDLARRVHGALRERLSAAPGGRKDMDLLLVSGERRVLERHTVTAARLRAAGFLPGGPAGAKVPAILVASSTVAESMDLGADRMVCDLVSLDRMILRFGRLARGAEAGGGLAVVVVDGVMLARRPEPEAARLDGVVRVLERLGEDGSQAAFLRVRARDPELFARGLPPDPYPPRREADSRGRRLPAWPAVGGSEVPEDGGEDAGATEILWRAHLPWRDGVPEPERADVEGYLAAAAPHPLEGLKASPSVVASLLIRRAGEVLRGAEAGTAPGGKKAHGVVLLSADGGFEEAFTPSRLAGMCVSELQARIEGGTVLCSAGLGGLDAEGRLDPACGGPVASADAGWPEEWRRCLGFRVRRVAGEGLCRLERGWNRLFVMDLARDDGEDGDFLVVDVKRGEGKGSGGNGDRIGGRERLSLVAAEVARLAEALELSGEAARALELAGAWLDLGRAHDLWRRAFSAPLGEEGGPGGKGGRGRDGFRDGWGSLFDMMEQIMPMDLDDGIRDLVHHLIGGHGGAVPLTPPGGAGCGEVAAEAGEEEARVRRARLEARYGHWGLAWLEMLLWVAECRAAPEKSPPCWRDGCPGGAPVPR